MYTLLAAGEALGKAAQIGAKAAQVGTKAAQTGSKAAAGAKGATGGAGIDLGTIEWILIGMLALVLVIAVVLLWRRYRTNAGPSPVKAPDDPPLVETWNDFIAKLTPKVQGAPTTLVIGDRRAGKTALVERARQGVLTGISSTVDLRLGLSYGDGQITAELATDVLDDAQAEGVRERRALFGRIGWQTPLVVIAIDSSAATASTRGLADLGRRTRVVIDELTSARGRRPWVRLCLTHADVSMPGYVEFLDALGQVTEAPDGNFELPLRPPHLSAEALGESVGTLRPYAMHTLRTPALPAALDVVEHSAPRMVSQLSAMMTPLFTSETGVQAPIFDGVYLAALLDRPRTVGDALEMSPVSPDVTRGRRKLLATRALQGVLAFAVLAGVLALPYVPHKGDIEWAQEEVRAFNSVADATGSSDRPLDSIAKEAADSLWVAINPLWPPLESAYAGTKAELVKSYALALRRAYFLPAARSADIDRRAAALAMLYIDGDAALQEAIGRDPETFARQLGVQRFVVDYGLRFTAEPPPEPPLLPPLIGDVGSRQALTLEWKRFLDGVAGAAVSERLADNQLETLDAAARHLAAGLDHIDTAWTTQTVIVALDERALPVNEWFGQAAVDQPVWLQEQREDLRAITEMVRGTSLAIPDPADKDLLDALADINLIAPPTVSQVIAAEAAGATTGASARSAAPTTAADTTADNATLIDLSVDGVSYRFDMRAWESLTVRSRVNDYIEGFLESVGPSSGDALLVGRQPCRGAIGAAFTSGRGSIFGLPCTYTRKTYEQYVAEPIAAVEPLMDRIEVPEIIRENLWDAIDAALDAYAINYGDALQSYFAGFELHCRSPEALQIDVGRMVAPGSFFVDFMETVAQNAALPETTEARGDITEVVASFAPIARVMEGQKGRYPALQAYLDILASTRPSLASRPRPAPKASAKLIEQLAPIGKLGLEMLTGGQTSPAERVGAWLDQQAMPEDLRGPFLAPIDCAWELGQLEVESVVALAYEREVMAAVRPLFSRFPFNRRAEADATAVQVKAVLGPEGSYRAAFKRIIGPVVREVDAGQYEPLRGLDGAIIKVPEGALELAEFVAQVQSTLWNAEGSPKTITHRIAPQPLPAGGRGRAPTLASLTAGKQVIYGFNQAPTWHDLAVRWGDDDTSSVAVRTASLTDTDERFGALEAGPSDWSYYRLLRLAKVTPLRNGDTELSWTISDSAPSTTPARFHFRDDPWYPFDKTPRVE